MDIHFKIIGILLMLLALIHSFFPKYFKWDKDLMSLSLINRQMMKTHTFFIALTVFLIGLLCFTSSRALIDTKLGKTLSLGLGIFWGIRLIIQFFGYSSKLWKGKRFETCMHVIFTMFWLYLNLVFWGNYFF